MCQQTQGSSRCGCSCARSLLAILGLLVSPILALVGLVLPTGGSLLVRTARVANGRSASLTQLSDALQLLVASLRSGYGLHPGAGLRGQEAEEPIRSEFERTLVEARWVGTFPMAIRAMATRMDNDDLEWVVGAVEINRDTGGNLAEILENVGAHHPGASAHAAQGPYPHR